MAFAPITLLDIAERKNGNKVAALIEDVVIAAPEWGLIPAITVDGTSYDMLRRVGLPHGRFRPVGDGVPMLKSEWSRETKPMGYFDDQLRIGQDIVLAQSRGNDAVIPDVLADEASANVTGSMIYFGTQTYYGTMYDPAGFLGLNAMVSDNRTAAQVTANVINPADINAGGAAGSTSSAYLCYFDDNPTSPKGLHFAIGLGGKMAFGDWMKLQSMIGTDANGHAKFRTDWTNAFEFYCGLNVGSKYAVFRIRNIDLTHPLTDGLAAQLISAIPVARRNNLRWLMNRTAAFSLQQARSNANVAVVTPGVPQGGLYAALPTELGGYPITVTDSLLNTETDGVATLPDYTDDIR